MRRVGLIALLCLAVAIVVPRSAGAAGTVLTADHEFGGFTGGDAITELWYRALTLPRQEDPYYGNGDPCFRMGNRLQVLLVASTNPIVCSVPEGTAVAVIGITTFCDDVERPPYFAVGEEAQRECARAALDPYTSSITLTVDGGPGIDIRTPAYEAIAPQRSAVLAPGNILKAHAGPVTFTVWGWVAWVTDLPRGRHQLVSQAVFTDGSSHFNQPIVDVVRRN